MAHSITLWGAGTSRTLRPIWVAEELGVAYELRPIGPRTGETQSAEFTRLCPQQKIPLLVSGSLQLSESMAICRYLVARFPADAIAVPDSLVERAREDQWCSYIYGELDETSLYVMRRHGDLADIYGSSTVTVAAAAAYGERHLRVLAEHLQDRPYVMDTGFGLADVLLTTCLAWARSYELTMDPVLSAYLSAMQSRPAFRKAAAANLQATTR
ncbi:MAG: glutathione S-transferase family protein [Pseudomonadales bacterium]